eukprot:4145051-Pleurochrysis_carterae.AAC.3
MATGRRSVGSGATPYRSSARVLHSLLLVKLFNTSPRALAIVRCVMAIEPHPLLLRLTTPCTFAVLTV